MDVTYKEEIDRKTVETLQTAVADYESHKITKRDFRMIYRGVFGATSGLTEWENLDCDFGDVNDRLYFVDFGYINWSTGLYKRQTYSNSEKDPTRVYSYIFEVKNGKNIRNEASPIEFISAEAAYEFLRQKWLQIEEVTRKSSYGHFNHVTFTNHASNLDK